MNNSTEIVTSLELVLKKLKNGDLSNIALIATSTDGMLNTVVSGNHYALLGLVDALREKLLKDSSYEMFPSS